MKILQGAMEEAFNEFPEQLVSKLIGEKLTAQGVSLTARQHKRLVDTVLGGQDSFVFRRWNWWEPRRITLEFTPHDNKQIQGKLEDFFERLPDLIDAMTHDLAQSALRDLKQTWPSESRRQRREAAGFRKRLYERWKPPLEGMRMLATISREMGESVIDEVRQSPDGSKDVHLIRSYLINPREQDRSAELHGLT